MLNLYMVVVSLDSQTHWNCTFHPTDGSTTSSICCLDVYECLDLSHFPELLNDVDYYQEDASLCAYVAHFPNCFESLRPICTKYEGDLFSNFNHSVQMVMDKYVYDESCSEDSGDYDWSQWTTWNDYTDFSREIDTGSNEAVIVGGVLGAVIVTIIASLLLAYFVRRHKCSRNNRPPESKEEDNPAYHMEHRPSADYDFIEDKEIRYVRMNLGREGKLDDAEVSSQSSFRGYDGLSNVQRQKEETYTSLSKVKGETDNPYISTTDSMHKVRISRLSSNKEIPNQTVGTSQESEYDTGHDYFVPQPDLSVSPPLPEREMRNKSN